MCEDFYTFSYVSGCCEIALEIFSGFHIDGPAVFDLSIANNITLQVKFRNLDDENRGWLYLWAVVYGQESELSAENWENQSLILKPLSPGRFKIHILLRNDTMEGETIHDLIVVGDAVFITSDTDSTKTESLINISSFREWTSNISTDLQLQQLSTRTLAKDSQSIYSMFLDWSRTTVNNTLFNEWASNISAELARLKPAKESRNNISWWPSICFNAAIFATILISAIITVIFKFRRQNTISLRLLNVKRNPLEFSDEAGKGERFRTREFAHSRKFVEEDRDDRGQRTSDSEDDHQSIDETYCVI